MELRRSQEWSEAGCGHLLKGAKLSLDVDGLKKVLKETKLGEMDFRKL